MFLAGEDNDAMLNERRRFLDPEGKVENLCELPGDRRDLSEILLEIEGTPIELLIVDPAIKYLGGQDEDNSTAINKFFSLLEDFAKCHNCAVLVIHHMVKKARTRTSREMITGIRGSGVFGDRPRVIIGVNRLANHTRIGISKNNLPPSCAMMEGDQLFVRDAPTLQHLPMKETSNPRGSAERAPGQGVNEADLLVVLGALKRLHDEGKSVVRFGKNSVYGRGAPEVQGMIRKAVERAVDALITSAQVVVTENGSIAVTVPKEPEF